ncbi:hypothetical protein Tco_1483069 [Tanacetum coccineum]
MSGQTGKGGGRTRGRSGDQGNCDIDGQGGQNGNAINDNIRGDVRNVIANNDCRGCTYKELLACNPKEYDGKGGAIVYTRWIKKMESIQDISGCEAAIGISWEDFKTLTREELYPSNEMQKMEIKLLNHTMVRAGHAAHTDRYVYGLAPQIRGMVVATEPKTIQKVVQIAGTLTDEALRNGSIKKNLEKRGNGGEPSKDRNVIDDNKRTRTRNAFAITTNPAGRETRAWYPSVPHVTLTIHLRRLVAHVSTVTTQVILQRIVELYLGM